MFLVIYVLCRECLAFVPLQKFDAILQMDFHDDVMTGNHMPSHWSFVRETTSQLCSPVASLM